MGGWVGGFCFFYGSSLLYIMCLHLYSVPDVYNRWLVQINLIKQQLINYSLCLFKFICRTSLGLKFVWQADGMYSSMQFVLHAITELENQNIYNYFVNNIGGYYIHTFVKWERFGEKIVWNLCRFAILH